MYVANDWTDFARIPMQMKNVKDVSRGKKKSEHMAVGTLCFSRCEVSCCGQGRKDHIFPCRRARPLLA